MSAHEIALGLQFLYDTFTGDSALMVLAPGGVKRGYAPPETATPYIIIAHQAGGDVTTMNGVRLMDDLLYQAKAVGPADISDQLASAAARIDDLCGGTDAGPASGPIVVSSVTVGQMLALYRQSPLFVDELVNGVVWSNVGGLYRAEIQQVR